MTRKNIEGQMNDFLKDLIGVALDEYVDGLKKIFTGKNIRYQPEGVISTINEYTKRAKEKLDKEERELEHLAALDPRPNTVIAEPFNPDKMSQDEKIWVNARVTDGWNEGYAEGKETMLGQLEALLTEARGGKK